MAGGQSRRMGQDKLVMPLADGRRLLDAAADALRAHCQHLVLLGPQTAALPVLEGFERLQDFHDPDVPLQAGPMAGLVAALVHAQQVGASWVLALAGDMPLIQERQLAGLIAQADAQREQAAVVPVSDHGPEPLAAAYPATLLQPAIDYLKEGRRSLRGFLSLQPWIALSATGTDTIPNCTNLNRPEDWERLPGPADQDFET
jgi:molybdenum cofactor guanylyltransferase